MKQCTRVYFWFAKYFWNLISFIDSKNQSRITVIIASTSNANHIKVKYRSTFKCKVCFKKNCLSFSLLKYGLSDRENYCNAYMYYYTHYAKPSFKSVHNIWYQIGPSSYNYSSANRLTNRCRYLSCNWQLWFNLKAINMSKEDLFYFDTSSINVKNINKVFFFRPKSMQWGQ